MEVNKGNILTLLNGDKQFITPVYQRTYSWKAEQCKRLWEDMLNVRTNVKYGHFIGSIVNISESATPSGISKFLIIDGQQRFTTVTLILIALRNFIIISNDSIVSYKKIEGSYLINSFEEGENKYKLILTQNDRNTLFELINNDCMLKEKTSKRILENYDFFYRKISSLEMTPDEIFDVLSKFSVVNITLDRQYDDPQLIFESLNSTGVDLFQSDLIRNFMLMGLSASEQDYIYNNLWYPMEQKFKYDKNNNLMDKFIRDYLTIKLGRIPTSSMVYEEFKQYRFHNMNFTIKDIAEELFLYSTYYTNIIYAHSGCNEIDRIFLDIRDLQSEVLYPFIMSIYFDFENTKINKNEFIEILKLCESYIFRRTICGIPTNSLNKTFATLKNNINYQNYVESIKSKIILMDTYKRFPNDSEFIAAFKIKDVFNMRIKNYILLKFENNENKAPININNYTIEHIMPQNSVLSEQWKENLGDNWKEIQKKYLHTIGNLTLTAYNSEMGDKPFIKKKNMSRGYTESALYINKDIINTDIWNEDTILKRAENLCKRALDIWKYPYISENDLEKYMSKIQEEQTYVLEDYEHLHNHMLDLFNELDKLIKMEFPNTVMECKKLYIAYKKNNLNFVDIIPQKSQLRICLSLKLDDIYDSKGICKDISDKGRWGNRNVGVNLYSEEQLNYIIELIRQSYERL